MQIIQIHQPIVEIDGKKIPVNSYMFKDLVGFQNDINKYENEGYTKCYLLSVYTQHDPMAGIIYWVRCKFIK